MKITSFRRHGFIPALILVFVSLSLARPAMAAPVKAPAFTAVTIDGKQISSASLNGKAYIVNFFATWCPPCRAEIPDMVAIQKIWAPRGFTFIGIAVNETEPAVKGFMKSNGINYPVVMATPALVSSFNSYVEGGISGIPTTFVVDANGNIATVFIGPRSREAFDQVIKASVAKRQGK
jgi:thiol-disulfide isomerase/thioredoxin